ncbi:hypothetical protein LEP1GSC062_3511 [Leptospira alexanderi serovar Manhao 3 str. L 60]|uniref:Uncharacterized protein n=1 Tax=Leptospira alexanderi serovar Manhao 3 str. L 60 TaxID=1049759 RepID=V6HZ86_9LEPT|nr:hypothetical protein LEP1GSC062_3511 [Leptospira alexanderi serovar Manhao 3 str. L 60]
MQNAITQVGRIQQIVLMKRFKRNELKAKTHHIHESVS